ncbi:amino acid adenylation domain-containing protein [Kitasatospora sp. NPDC048545]|uniref:amino acid adenylation domain-containing protein n=1 Tax=Kitasatospora sp. NPDC048545 TaxID=3157208 RepID=UPI003403AF73
MPGSRSGPIQHSHSSTTTLVTLLVEQFRRTPHRAAVSDRHEVIDYRELDRRSAALAVRLVRAGAAAGHIVALHLERSVDLAVAIVAVLRAGAAWLPLATADPDSRIRDLLRDAAPVAVLTGDPARLGALSDGTPCLAPGDAWDTDAGTAPIDAAGPTDLAYVIYTSGSTGRPKGVLTEHAAIVNRLRWMQDRFGLGPADVVAQKTPYTFDVSVWEFLWPLLTGAQLTFAEPDGHRDPDYLRRFLTDRRVTVTHFVPSMLREFLRRLPAGACPELRAVTVSGEALGQDLAQRFFERLPHVELHNLYGPTEAAVDVTHWQCEPGRPLDEPVPIGRPISGVELLVMDEHGAELPVGATGELCIAGVGVARGYLNRPELTAERFVPHPADPQRRMYRTGDLASCRPDGAYLYHGRNDRQVKIGGVRIELGEVEAALLALPYLDECVVLTQTDTAGTARLAAVAVPAAGADHEDWRADLARVLPAASIPATLTAVDAIPRTAHGKADVAALRPLVEPAPAGAPAVEGLEPVERAWVTVLGSRLPHFFEAGGTSLHAVRLLGDLAEQLGARVPVADFLARPTLDGLRALVADAGHRPQELPDPVPRDGVLRPNHAQERLWFLQELEPDSTAMSAPSAFRITGATREQVTEAFARLLERHEVLRTRYTAVDGEPHAVIAPAGPRLEWTDAPAGADPGGLTRTQVAELADRPFDLSAGAPLRVRGVSFGADDQLLVVATHQIITDGWTWSLLTEDLLALLTGGEPAAPERRQIVDHAAWQRGHEAGPEHRAAVDESLRHWHTTLAGAPDGLDLPTDARRPAALSVPADSVDLTWSPGFDDRLRALCRERKVTEFMALLAGYTAWLARISGQETVVVGTPMANRTPEWTDRMAGNFITTVPQRLEVDEDATFLDLLDRARTAVVDGARHSVVPMERIVAELGGARGADRLPVFQNLFVFQNMPAWRREADGRTVQVLQFPPRHTHYDLKFEVFPFTTGYEARLVHARGRISAERAAVMVRQLAAFIEAAVDEPDAYVDEIPL